MKVQVNLSDELVSKIDSFAKAMGVSRSALCGVWIGQTVMSMGKTLETGQKAFTQPMKTICVKDGKTYLLTSKIEERPDGSFVADGQTPEGNDCLIKWFIPHPVDVNDPSDWEEADEVITW